MTYAPKSPAFVTRGSCYARVFWFFHVKYLKENNPLGIIIAVFRIIRGIDDLESYDLLEKNRALFFKMKELAMEQEKLILDDQVEGFLNLSIQREHLQNEITENNEEYKSPVKEVDDKGKTITLEISDVIHSIQEIDRKIEEFITQKKDSIASDIKGYRKGQKALKSYFGQSTKRNKFINRAG